MKNSNENNSVLTPVQNASASICTLGCRVNQYESRAIEEALESRGFTIKDFDDICDVYIINTCAVTAESFLLIAHRFFSNFSRK